MATWRARLVYLRRRSPRQLFMLAEATVLLSVARAAILMLPHKHLAKHFGEPLDETPHTSDDEALRRARTVGWAITRVADHTPWTSNCLPQAMAARRMLKWRGLPCTLSIGAKFAEDEPKLMAHAWSRSGQAALTGGRRNEAYGGVITYATHARS